MGMAFLGFWLGRAGLVAFCVNLLSYCDHGLFMAMPFIKKQ